jgi:hypothetical protein
MLQYIGMYSVHTQTHKESKYSTQKPQKQKGNTNIQQLKEKWATFIYHENKQQN